MGMMGILTMRTGKEELLERVGEHVRTEQEHDRLLERAARGEASSEELAELERASRHDAELALELEGSRPLEPAVADRIAARVLASRPRVLPMRRVWPRVSVLLGPLAVAAAVAVYLGARPSQDGDDGPALPPYSVVATGEQAMRGPAEPTARLRVSGQPSARFEVVLRPATAPAARVVAYAFVVEDGGSAVTPLDATVEVSAEGAVRITGTARSLEGTRELRVVVGAPAAIGSFDGAAERAKTMSGAKGASVFAVPIDRN
jgi:hypothetical protein